MTQGGQSWAESAIHRNTGTGWSSWLDPAAASRRWPRSSSRRRRRYATGSTRRTGRSIGTTRRSFASCAASWRGSRKSGTYWQRPRPGSPRRPRGPQAGLRVHEGAPGRVQHSRHVSSAASLPQRILCVAEASPVAVGRGGSGAPGAHTPDPRRVEGHLRCASGTGEAAGAGRSREPSQDRPSDGEGRPSRGVPTPSLEHHAFGRLGGRRRSGQSGVPRGAARRALGGGRHLRSDGGGNAVSGGRPGRVLAPHRGLVHGATAEGGAHDPGAQDGRRTSSAPEPGDASLRPRVPVHLGSVSGSLRGVRRHGVDGLGGRLLRQRDGGELLRHPGDRADRPAAPWSLREPGAGAVDDLRLCRGVLQHAETAFVAGIPVADGVRASPRGSEMKNKIFSKKKRPVEMWTTLSSSPHSHEAQQQQFKTCPLTCGNLIKPNLKELLHEDSRWRSQPMILQVYIGERVECDLQTSRQLAGRAC